MCSAISVVTLIAWPSPIIAWFPLLTERSRFVGAIPPTTTNRSCCLFLSMSSCAASCCTSCPKVSCVSAISASWPIADVPPACHFVFLCSAQHHKPRQRYPPPLRAMLGFVPGAVGRCYSSKGLQLRRSNSVLHRPRMPLPHEINLCIPKLSHVSQRSVSL